MAMAPVKFQDRLYGHIVAIDRLVEGCYWQILGEPMSEHEFGTVESSLIDATAAMLATHHRNYELFHAREKLVTGVIRTLGGAVDARDPYTKGHSDRVALYSREIAREMQLDEIKCQRIYLTGLLHDVGKIGIPDSILKKPGKLTDFEYEVIKSHSQLGYDILEGLEDIEFVLPGVLHHHERIDGRGYPYGLAGDAIPLDARILAVADAYDAMTSSRSYRECMPFDKAERIVLQNIGSQFDETAALAFLRILPKIHTIASSEKYGQKVDSIDVDDTMMANELIATLHEIDSAVAVARDE
jgi:HD-GYP domain-containing protein (c-di-GMP phosphodiesterase class II)